EDRLERCLADDRRAGFALARPPLMRLYLVRTADEEYRFVWTHHMIALDGWSVPLVTGEGFRRYAAPTAGHAPEPPAAAAFGAYVAWLQLQDVAGAEAFWRAELAGLVPPTLLVGGRAAGETVEVVERRVEVDAETDRRLHALAVRCR